MVNRVNGFKYYMVAGSPYSLAQLAAGSNPKCGLYVIEGNPDQAGLVATQDWVFNAGSGSGFTIQEIGDGYYAPNWNHFGDPNLRKQISVVDMIGDGMPASSLSNAPPVTLQWIPGFTSISRYPPFGASSGAIVVPSKVTNEATGAGAQNDQYFRFKITQPHHNFWKFLLRIRPHATDYGTLYSVPGDEGDLAKNFYGAVVALLYQVGPGENRL
jgi:hypothetical protein